MIVYSPDLGMFETIYRSCRRCGINMQILAGSPRYWCDDCVEYEFYEYGQYDWLFND